MNPENLWYWRRGFNYDKSHPTLNKLAVETYRILVHYTTVHKNCRVGTYLSQSGQSQFYPLDRLIPNFDAFSEIATGNESSYSRQQLENTIKDKHSHFQDQVIKVWSLQWPIWFEYESKCLLKEVLGYKFKRSDKPLAIKISPNDIKALTGDSLRMFSIEIKDYTLRIEFGSEISII